MHIHGALHHPEHGELIRVVPDRTEGFLAGKFLGVVETGLRAYIVGADPYQFSMAFGTKPSSPHMAFLLEELLPENPDGPGRIAAEGYVVLLEKHPHGRLLHDPEYISEATFVHDQGVARGIGQRSVSSLLSHGWQGRRGR